MRVGSVSPESVTTQISAVLQSQLCGERSSPSGRRCKVLRAWRCKVHTGTRRMRTSRVNFRLRQAVRVQLKGGSIYYEIQRAPDNDVGHFDSTMLTRLDKHTTHTLSYCATARRGLVHSIGRRWGSDRSWLGPVRLRRRAGALGLWQPPNMLALCDLPTNAITA